MKPLAFLVFVMAVNPLNAAVTFNKQIAPIVFRYCAPCHRPGEAAPFSLLTYNDARRHAAQIATVTRSRYMPPWPPATGIGDFSGDRHLTDAQIQLISAWLAEGAPEGVAADLPSPPQFTEGWQSGPPDLIVRMPEAFRMPASGPDVFRNFVIPVNIAGTRYVRAVEIRPGNPRIVHHANLVIDRAQSLRNRPSPDGQPGFPGMDVTTESGSAFDPDSHFLFWKPGSGPQYEPEDMAWRLDSHTDLILNMHLKPSGKAELVQPSIGLYFASRPPTRFPMLLQLEHDGAIDIPAGAINSAVTDQFTLPVAVDLLSIYPHAHYLGKRVEAWATLPDGSRRSLILIEDWDINWQAVYTYRRPVRLPAGTVVAMRITYDNSPGNPRNPNHPPKRVRTGDRSEDEMGHVWLQVLPASNGDSDPRLALQEALMRRRLEKYPADFTATYNLAALLQHAGNLVEAIRLYQSAIRLEPSRANAHNALAAALLSADRIDEALVELREAIRVEPDYADAHINLGAAYLARKDYAGALPEFREAARLAPDDADLQTNFGTLLAMQGDLRGAIAAFQKALKIDPSNETARVNLSRAQK